MLKKIFEFLFLKKLKIEENSKSVYKEYSVHLIDGKFLTPKEYQKHLNKK